MGQIQYSEKYFDDTFEYRHVVLPPDVAKMLPKNRLLSETIDHLNRQKTNLTQVTRQDISTLLRCGKRSNMFSSDSLSSIIAQEKVTMSSRTSSEGGYRIPDSNLTYRAGSATNSTIPSASKASTVSISKSVDRSAEIAEQTSASTADAKLDEGGESGCITRKPVQHGPG